MRRGDPYFEANGRFIHWCQHPGCARWGSSGTGVSLLRYLRTGVGKWLGTWFCEEHAKSVGRRMP